MQPRTVAEPPAWRERKPRTTNAQDSATQRQRSTQVPTAEWSRRKVPLARTVKSLLPGEGKKAGWRQFQTCYRPSISWEMKA